MSSRCRLTWRARWPSRRSECGNRPRLSGAGRIREPVVFTVIDADEALRFGIQLERPPIDAERRHEPRAAVVDVPGSRGLPVFVTPEPNSPVTGSSPRTRYAPREFSDVRTNRHVGNVFGPEYLGGLLVPSQDPPGAHQESHAPLSTAGCAWATPSFRCRG